MKRATPLLLFLVALGSGGAAPSRLPDASQQCGSSPEAMRAWYQRYTDEVWNHRNLGAAARRYWGAAFANRYAPSYPPGAEGMRAQAEPFLAAFSDLRFTVDDVAVDEDRLVARVTITGRHTGTFAGTAPTLQAQPQAREPWSG